MAAKELVENPKTPNVNFISFQNQIAKIITDIREHNKKSGVKKSLAANMKTRMLTAVSCKVMFQITKRFQS